MKEKIFSKKTFKSLKKSVDKIYSVALKLKRPQKLYEDNKLRIINKYNKKTKKLLDGIVLHRTIYAEVWQLDLIRILRKSTLKSKQYP